MEKMPIRSRREIPQEYTWDLTPLFSSDEDWFLEYEALKALPEEVSSFRGRLGEGAATLLCWLEKQDEAEVRLMKLFEYASCRSDEDTSDSRGQDLRSRAMATVVAIQSAAAFSVPELLAIPDETLESWYRELPALETYRRSLYRVRRRKDHVLSAEGETLLAAAGEMANTPGQIASVFRNADLTFPPVTDSEGNEHQLTGGTFVPLLESPDRTLRENAFRAYYKQLGSFRNTVASSLDAQFKQLLFFSRARGYATTRAASLDETEVPEVVYDRLIESVHANFDPMYRYVALRRKMLGVDELHMYDVYTPLVADAAVSVSFEEAKETVLGALSVLGEDYTALLREGFENRWIDVYENVGKRSGAYSTGNARPHPYVLLNFNDNLDSMFTLAHEMGHALHSYYSCKNQPVNTADYVIFVAEVASTCNEILLMKALLARTQDKKQRAYLINHFLDQFKGTVYRQTMFAEFEREMGRFAESGQALTADLLCEKYHELNKLYFGPDMVSDDEIALEWARIPHFFYNYYVFQYATGFSAAVAIAERILALGESAVADYKRFLSGGGSADPVSLLKIAGVDMSTPEPVNSALRLFSELVDELEALQD